MLGSGRIFQMSPYRDSSINPQRFFFFLRVILAAGVPTHVCRRLLTFVCNPANLLLPSS